AYSDLLQSVFSETFFTSSRRLPGHGWQNTESYCPHGKESLPRAIALRVGFERQPLRFTPAPLVQSGNGRVAHSILQTAQNAGSKIASGNRIPERQADCRENRKQGYEPFRAGFQKGL